MRRQKLLPFTLLLFTLSLGIVIGTLINTKVTAARTQAVAPDATPLTIPSPVPLGNDFTKLAKKLAPSVVNITADYVPKEESTRVRPPRSQDDGDNNSGDGDGSDLLRRFFRDPFGGHDLGPHNFKREQSGSGFIVDSHGYIITNYHVVEKMDRIKVRLHGDDTDYDARIVGADPESDLAVLKIDSKAPLVPVMIGNSDAVQVGDWTVAIGSPFGLDASVTAGIISATGRDINTSSFQRFIQTDAAINPGNSGGPLLNIRGEVIGVNTMIATESGGYQGIGFALPINMAVRVYNDIIRDGKVTRGWIGVRWNRTDKPDLLRALGTNHGVVVLDATKGGPADKAGIKADDIIVSLNGKPVKDGNDLLNRVADLPVGSAATVTVNRDGKNEQYKLTIGNREQALAQDPEYAAEFRPQPAPPPESHEVRFGIGIRPLNDVEKDDVRSLTTSGVKVTHVEPGSFADDASLLEGDIIMSINRHPVNSVDDVRKVQSELRPGSAVAFHILRNAAPDGAGKAQWVAQFLSGTLPVE
jgi:serine protease Do